MTSVRTPFVNPDPVTFEAFLVGCGVDSAGAREEFYQAMDRKSDDLETPGRWKRLVIADAMRSTKGK